MHNDADAAIVFLTDARKAAGKVNIVEAKSDTSDAIYMAAPIRGHGEKLGWNFVQYLRSPTAQSAMRAAGFMPPEVPVKLK